MGPFHFPPSGAGAAAGFRRRRTGEFTADIHVDLGFFVNGVTGLS